MPAYPKLPKILADQLALIAAEGEEAEVGEPEERTDLNTGEVTEGPVTRPWDLGELVGKFAAEVYGWLDEAVLWFNQAYGWQEDQLIPACWQEHWGLALDFAAVAFNRLDIYANDSPAYVSRWHGEWDDLQRRMGVAFGENSGRDCRSGRHTDPGTYSRESIEKAVRDRQAAA